MTASYRKHIPAVVTAVCIAASFVAAAHLATAQNNVPAPISDEIRRDQDVTCTPVQYGQLMSRTKQHMDVFFPKLLTLKGTAQSALVAGNQMVELARDCRKRNCGAECSCSESPATKANVCGTINYSCNATGTQVFSEKFCRDVQCRENKTTQHCETVNLLINCTPGDSGSRDVCSAMRGISACGSECCLSPSYSGGGGSSIPPPPGQGGSPETKHLDCNQVDTCTSQQPTCTGQGTGKRGEAPCPEGISDALQRLKDLLDQYKKDLGDIQQLEGELDGLMQKNTRVSGEFGAWYDRDRQRGVALLDCPTVRDMQSCEVPSCPYGGTTYYLVR